MPGAERPARSLAARAAIRLYATSQVAFGFALPTSVAGPRSTILVPCAPERSLKRASPHLNTKLT
eukprot:4404739-Prymnesium_polylepis.1